GEAGGPDGLADLIKVDRLTLLGLESDRAALVVLGRVSAGYEPDGVLLHVILTCDGVARHPASSAHFRASDSHDPLDDLRVRRRRDRKSTRLNSSHVAISYAVFCLKKKKTQAVL